MKKKIALFAFVLSLIAAAPNVRMFDGPTPPPECPPASPNCTAALR